LTITMQRILVSPLVFRLELDIWRMIHALYL